MSEDMEERIPDADVRAGSVIQAIENLANNRDHDLERLANADDDDLKAALDVMSYALPDDFDLTMTALRNAARGARSEKLALSFRIAPPDVRRS